MYKTYTITYQGAELVQGMRPIGEKIIRRTSQKEAIRDFRLMHKAGIEAGWGMKVKVLGASRV